MSRKFEMYVFKIALVINENVRCAFLFVLSIYCIVPLKGNCIAKWNAVFRYLVKLTELETSWGRGDTVTY